MSIGDIFGGGAKDAARDAERSSEAEIASTQRSAKEWNDFVSRYIPANDRFIQLVEDKQPGRFSLRRKVNADAMRKAGLAPSLQQAGFTGGLDSNSGASVGRVIDSAEIARRGLSAGVGAAEPQLEERKVRGQLALAAQGRGLADDSNLALSNQARLQAANATNDAVANFRQRSEMMGAALNTVGTVAGNFDFSGGGSGTDYAPTPSSGRPSLSQVPTGTTGLTSRMPRSSDLYSPASGV